MKRKTDEYADAPEGSEAELKLAGCGPITEDDAVAIYDDVVKHCSYLVSEDYIAGFAGGVLYSTVPKDADTYNRTPHEYVMNGYRGHKLVADTAKRLLKYLGL